MVAAVVVVVVVVVESIFFKIIARETNKERLIE
jgi:hypothetical protein